MIIGVDFDNTIVCYDSLFYKTALDKGLIPKALPKIKSEVRDYLRKACQEDEWIKLQGHVYGPGILGAKPFKGVIGFFRQCRRENIPVFIISHKTLSPFSGLKHDLHEYAHKWLEHWGFYDKRVALDMGSVFFELTKESKIRRIVLQKCTHFIDDLPEFLDNKEFPDNVKKILFDPNGRHDDKKMDRINSWENLADKLE